MADPLRVLIIDDSEADAELESRALRAGGRAVVTERVDGEAELRLAIGNREWDVVLCDWSMPSFSAPRALEVVRETGLELPFLIVSGTVGEETAVEALRAGAWDYLVKGRLARLPIAVERAIGEGRERQGRKRAERELARSQQQLHQAQKMESVGRLAGGVAHDFNNLLSVILTYSDLLLMDAATAPAVRESVTEIGKAGQRAAALTKQLLAFSRQQVLETKVIDLNEVVRGVGKMLQRLIGEDMEIATALGAGLGRVRADPGQMEQVLMNLAVNARDAMPGGGKLTIETANVELGEDYAREHLGVQPGPHVMLAVSDNGVGMDKATQARIFEPFFTTKEVGKGTGLGLATCFGIVKQSGGHIWVYSELGRGTTFKVYLPRTDEVAAPSVAAHAVAGGGGETILLVEDEPQLRGVLLAVLAKGGYRVLETEGPEDALARAGAHAGRIDLLLTDVVMPGLSGPELARRVEPGRPEMKVLFMSGYTDEAVLRHGLINSGRAFLQKPITPERLLRKIRETLAG